jgi:hypothetical protein
VVVVVVDPVVVFPAVVDTVAVDTVDVVVVVDRVTTAVTLPIEHKVTGIVS